MSAPFATEAPPPDALAEAMRLLRVTQGSPAVAAAMAADTPEMPAARHPQLSPLTAGASSSRPIFDASPVACLGLAASSAPEQPAVPVLAKAAALQRLARLSTMAAKMQPEGNRRERTQVEHDALPAYQREALEAMRKDKPDVPKFKQSKHMPSPAPRPPPSWRGPGGGLCFASRHGIKDSLIGSYGEASFGAIPHDYEAPKVRAPYFPSNHAR